MRTLLRRVLVALVLVGLLVSAQPQMAQAQMVWDTVLDDVSTSLTGPTVAKAFVIAVVIFGIMWWAGFSMITSGIGLLIGGAIAANAATIAAWMGFQI